MRTTQSALQRYAVAAEDDGETVNPLHAPLGPWLDEIDFSHVVERFEDEGAEAIEDLLMLIDGPEDLSGFGLQDEEASRFWSHIENLKSIEEQINEDEMEREFV